MQAARNDPDAELAVGAVLLGANDDRVGGQDDLGPGGAENIADVRGDPDGIAVPEEE